MTQVVAITTTKTSRHKDSAEYWVSDYGSLEEAKAAAKANHPRKRRFYLLKTSDGWNMTAEEITL